MDYDFVFAEIFDGSNARQSLGNPQTFRDVQPVPVLDSDPLVRDFGKSGSASELCHALESESLLDELVGPRVDISQPPATPKPAPPAPGTAAFGEFIKTWTDRPLPVAKASAGNWESTKHQRIVRNIVAKARQKLRTTSPDADDLWESLVSNMVDHCCACEHAACGGA